MSHISKIDTKIRDLRCLKKALESMQMGYTEAQEGQLLTLCGYGKGEEISGCIMEIKTGSKYGIGIRKNGENYEFAADWWAIETFTGQKQDELLNKITRQYAYETVLEKVRNIGYSIVDETQDLQWQATETEQEDEKDNHYAVHGGRACGRRIRASAGTEEHDAQQLEEARAAFGGGGTGVPAG